LPDGDPVRCHGLQGCGRRGCGLGRCVGRRSALPILSGRGLAARPIRHHAFPSPFPGGILAPAAAVCQKCASKRARRPAKTRGRVGAVKADRSICGAMRHRVLRVCWPRRSDTTGVAWRRHTHSNLQANLQAPLPAGDSWPPRRAEGDRHDRPSSRSHSAAGG
jgi:hypothetical protein